MPLSIIRASKSITYPVNFLIFVSIAIFVEGLFIVDNFTELILLRHLIYTGKPHYLTVFWRIPYLNKNLVILLAARTIFCLSIGEFLCKWYYKSCSKCVSNSGLVLFSILFESYRKFARVKKRKATSKDITNLFVMDFDLDSCRIFTLSRLISMLPIIFNAIELYKQFMR